MKQLLLLSALLAFLPGFSQDEKLIEGGLPPEVSKRNIFRLALTAHLPEDEYIPLALHYERKLGKQVTFYTKSGPSLSPINSPWSRESFHYSLNVYASAEIRLYINQLRRERRQKNAVNFSSNYISLEQYVISNPLLVSGVAWKDGQPGSTGTFLNIGMQRELGGFYLNIFWGPRLAGSFFGDWPTSLSDHRGGISLGIVW